MKLALTIAIGVLALAACQPATAPAPEAAAKPPVDAAANADAPADDAAAGCNAKAETAWGPPGPSDHPSYRIEAFTNGPICEASVVTLVIRARDGFPIYAWAGPTQYLFNLNEVTDPAAMPAALAEWLAPDARTTADLPAWETTDGQPQRAEFPLMPAAGMDKASYDALRAEKAPAYCFPQGMESLRCLALRDGEIEEIGLQLFPG